MPDLAESLASRRWVPLMDMDDFLKRKGTDVVSVVEGVAETIGLGPSDVLLAVGSIVEGLGTNKSDLDLFLIGPRPIPAQESTTLVVGKCVIDLRLVGLAEYEALFARFDSWSQSPWNVTHAVKFSLDERTLLHRVLHSEVLYAGPANDVTLPVAQQAALARLKLHVSRQMARTIQVDMVGYREAGDYRSLSFAAQELLGQVVDALCAGHLLTNPLLKWRSRMLDRLPAEWEHVLTMRPIGLAAGEFIWRLHRGPELPEAKSSLEHALRISTFARTVFSWAELHLMGGSATKAELKSWPLTDQPSAGPVLPNLEFDVDFFFADGRVKVARLNEFGEAIDVSPHEFALVLLCDGTTSVREAEMIIYGESADSESRLDRLLSEVNRTGLAFHPALKSRTTECSPTVGSG